MSKTGFWRPEDLQAMMEGLGPKFVGTSNCLIAMRRDIEAIGTAVGRDVRVSTSRTSIVLPVRADATVTKGTAWVPFNQVGADIRELIDGDQPVIDVRVENLK